ncbi:MAG: hypothetical protein RBS07_18120, partial [Lentimicrobium sp.]|nr:hypothetical protein [Lentimicrobium sp.]
TESNIVQQHRAMLLYIIERPCSVTLNAIAHRCRTQLLDGAMLCCWHQNSKLLTSNIKACNIKVQGL